MAGLQCHKFPLKIVRCTAAIVYNVNEEINPRFITCTNAHGVYDTIEARFQYLTGFVQYEAEKTKSMDAALRHIHKLRKCDHALCTCNPHDKDGRRYFLWKYSQIVNKIGLLS